MTMKPVITPNDAQSLIDMMDQLSGGSLDSLLSVMEDAEQASGDVDPSADALRKLRAVAEGKSVRYGTRK